MKKIVYSICLFAGAYMLPAQIQVTSGVSAAALVSSFAGTGISISNVSLNCPTNAYGTFSNGNTTNIGLTSGVILTTGNASGIVGPNSGGSFGICNGTSGGDPDLLAYYPSATEDNCMLEFDLVPQCNQLGIRFVFGSEEYPEFVGAGYNDAFAIFVSGPGPACQAGYYNATNVATLPNNTTPVSIDNVNSGSNSAYYVNNAGGSTIQYDGFTTALTRSLSVCACQTYHFKIVIADAGDCYYDSGVLINFFQCNNTLSATVNTTNATCGLSNGSATATVSSGTGPFTYSWAPAPGSGQNTATASGLTPGTTYTLTVNDGLSCSPAYTTAITVSSTSAPTATVTSTSVSCNGGNNGSATVTASGGTPGYTYSWTPSGGTNATASGLSQGTYTCTITDANSCQKTQIVTINQPTAITAVVSSTNVSCNGGSDGSATIGASGGIPGYTYSWTPSGGTSATASGLSQGTYTCTITDTKSCQKTQTVTIDQPAAISKTQSFTVCAGGSVIVGSNTYTASGTYTDVLTAVNGCDSTVNTSLSVLPAISKTQSFTICAGRSVTVGPNIYTASGTYTDILMAANGCDSTVTTQLSVENTIDVSTSTSGATITASTTGAAYQWIDCTNGNAAITGETNQSFTATTNGNYAVIVTVNNCSDTSACVNIISLGLHHSGKVAAFTVFPNPSFGVYTVSGLQPEATLQVYNSTGQLLKTIHTTDTELSLNLSEERSGIYLLIVSTAKGDVRAHRLIKK